MVDLGIVLMIRRDPRNSILGGKSLAKHQAWLSARTCPVIELRGDLSVRERVAAVLKHVTNASIGRAAQNPGS